MWGSGLHLGLQWLMLLIAILSFPEHICTSLGRLRAQLWGSPEPPVADLPLGMKSCVGSESVSGVLDLSSCFLSKPSLPSLCCLFALRGACS